MTTSKTDVVFSWSGSLNTTGATPGDLFGGFAALVRPRNAEIALFSKSQNNTTPYTISGPGIGALGTGSDRHSFTSSSGDVSFGIGTSGSRVWLSQNYVSNSSISGESTLADNTLAGIGLNVGSYTWTLAGSNDTITMNVVPEPSTTALLFGLACGIFAVFRRFKTNKPA